MVSFGSQRGSAELQTRELPGVFGAEDPGAPRRLGLNIENLLGQDVGFGGRTQAENQLLSELIDITGAQTAVRGLGAPTAENIASSIAPTLLNFRQQRVAERGQRGGLLLELLGLAAPQVVAGQRERQRGTQFGIVSGGS
jgi:hypothetical protein